MAWYSFYTYVRLPFAILVEICSIINIYLNNYKIDFQILLSVLSVIMSYSFNLSSDKGIEVIYEKI